MLKTLIALALIVAAVLAGAVSMYVRPARPGSRTSRLDRDVEIALTHPAYAPYGPDGEDRVPAQRRPLPSLDGLDPAVRLTLHQECVAWPCDHIEFHDDRPYAYTIAAHCRCGEPWVCALAGPLNPEIPAQRDGSWS